MYVISKHVFPNKERLTFTVSSEIIHTTFNIWKLKTFLKLQTKKKEEERCRSWSGWKNSVTNLTVGMTHSAPNVHLLMNTHTQTHIHNTSATITATARAQSHRARCQPCHVFHFPFYNKAPNAGSYIRIVKAYISALVQESWRILSWTLHLGCELFKLLKGGEACICEGVKVYTDIVHISHISGKFSRTNIVYHHIPSSANKANTTFNMAHTLP